MGTAAAGLGLAGRVDPAALRRVLPRARGRVPGFDLTFAAPKSVSVLHGLGRPQVVGAVRSAHDAAVAAGLGYVERHAAAVRIAGRVTDASGLVVAAFRHRVSRADDPHLHTHALVANTAPCDGVWRALHSPLLYAAQRGAGAVYQCVLRHELTSALGVTWTPPVGGRADIIEVPVAVRAMFSQRRAALLAEAGGDLTDRRWAERFTRPEREDLVDMDGLRQSWATRCAWVPPPLGPPRAVAVAVAEIDRAGVTPTDDRWTRSILMVALADRLPAGARADRLEAMAEDLLTRPEVRPLGRPGGRHAAERYTTAEASARQARLVEVLGPRAISDAPSDLDRLRRACAPGRVMVVVGDDVAAAAIADRAGVLAVAARDAARAIDEIGLRSGDLLVVSQPERRDSRALEAGVRRAHERRIEVVCGRPPDHSPDIGLQPGPVATVDLIDGSMTVAPSAGCAAEQAINDWAAARRAGRDAVLVAERSELAAIAPRARAALQAYGLVAPADAGGWARGDVVVFPSGRPSLGLARYGRATVDEAGDRLRLVLDDGRRVEVAPAWLAGVEQGHVVPPAPQLVAGRGDVYVVGGRRFAARHVSGHEVHHYVTVDVGDGRAGPIPGWRRAGLASLDRWLASEEAARGTGDNRRATQHLRSASEWLAHAEAELGRAGRHHDTAAARTWEAQRAAARRELTGLGGGAAELPSRRDMLVVQRDLRVEAMVRADERRGPRLGSCVEREAGREAARMAARERGREPREFGLSVGR